MILIKIAPIVGLTPYHPELLFVHKSSAVSLAVFKGSSYVTGCSCHSVPSKANEQNTDGEAL